ncbi:hypothetical protein [uncultured Pluralibacter sp.]|uniref:hypothetical protein n=1 Tax=uncultured Pluralibacter sp. TaxID=1490864 RepID=UPI002618F6D3|nr:hypothetical protein [uncultured Pluralibacter sp.]
MPSHTDKKIKCMSCHLHCDLLAPPTIKKVKCVENQYTLWPDNNYYLRLGIQFLILNSHYNFSYTGFIFVDFSCHNIRYFTNNQWLQNLSKSGLKLILVTDKVMEPLAFYWKAKSHLISTVITSNDDYAKIDKIINYCFTGHHDRRASNTKFNDLEIAVLDLMLAEKNIKEMSETLQINEKRIYYAKGILQKKMGGRGKLNTVISS